MSNTSKITKIILPLVIIIAAIFITKMMAGSRQAAERTVKVNQGVLVQSIQLFAQPYQIQIHTSGTVRPAQESKLAAEIAGRVVYVSDNLKDGAFVKRGSLLLRIDGSNYQFALESALSTLARTELERDLAVNRAEVAKAEWDRFGTGSVASPLTLNIPQVKSAEASVEAAKGAVKKARLDLKRTEIRAPFDGLIRSEQVDLGQYLQPGASVITLVGTNKAEVVAAIAAEDILFIDIPRPGSTKPGPHAELTVRKGQSEFTRKGQVSRTLGEADERGRMEQVVVTIDDPFGMKSSELSPLLVGSFVSIDIEGKLLPSVILVPASVLRNKNSIWVIDAENKLQIVTVDVIKRTKDGIVIESDLKVGTEIITSPLSGAANGLKVRRAGVKQ